MVALKRTYPFIVLVVSLALLAPGCRKESADRSLSRAVTELEMFGKSRAVMFAGVQAPEVSGGAVTKVKQLVQEQQKAFKDSMDDLKRFADAPVETNVGARDGARTKTLLAAMLAYQANWKADDLRLFDGRSLGLVEKIRLVLIGLDQLKAEQATVRPGNYTAAIEQSQKGIAELKESQKTGTEQLQQVTTAIGKLKDRLADAVKRRDNLNQKVGDLTDQLHTVSAQKAVGIQKAIGDLERERFKVLIEIERLTAGPMDLPAELAVQVNNRKLAEIRGLKQLDEEKALLETQLKGTGESIKAQEAYLENLQQQVKIAEEKSRALVQQRDKVTQSLNGCLKELEAVATERADLVAKADAEAQNAERYAKQASGDLGRYVGAVGQAKNQVAPGREDAFLTGAEATENLQFTIGNVQANAQLAKAAIKADTLRFEQTLAPILKRSGQHTSLPAALSKVSENAAADEKTLSSDLAKLLEQAVAQYNAVNTKASRGAFKNVVGTSLALVLTQAAALVPEAAAKYKAQAKDVLDKISPAPAAGASASTDPDLQTARQLRRELGV